MIFPLKRNFRDKIFEVSQDFSRGACEGPKFSRLKISRPDKNPRNPRKFSPSKFLGYTVYNRDWQRTMKYLFSLTHARFTRIKNARQIHNKSASLP